MKIVGKAKNVLWAYLSLALFPALCLSMQVSAQVSAQIRPRQNHPDKSSARKNNESIRWRPRVDSRAEFDSLARIYYEGRFYALPHLMFVIDRAAKAGTGNRVYYVNSKRYSFHGEFANANYLTLERGREFFRAQLSRSQSPLHSRLNRLADKARQIHF